MNIKEVQIALHRILPDLQLTKREFIGQPNYDIIYYGLDKFRRALNTIGIVADFLLLEVDERELGPILDDNSLDQYPTFKYQSEGIQKTASEIYDKVADFIEYLDRILIESNEETISVKLVKVDDLNELEKITQLLKRAFDTPAYLADGRIVIGNIESGSIWITLGVISATGYALKMLAELIWASVVINNEFKRAKLYEEFGRTIELKNNMLETISEHYKNYVEKIQEAEANHIINEYLPGNNNPETLSQIKLSLDSFNELIEKGAQFYPSVKASDEIKKLFPEADKLSLVQSKIKMLDEGKKED